MALTASWQDTGLSDDPPAGRAARQRAFAAARRHSGLVRILRVLLPVAAILAVAGFFIKAHLAFPGDLDLSAASLSVTPKAIIMDRPHLNGFDKKRREYSLMADRAIQPLANPQQVRLENIQAKLAGAGQGATDITAEAGDYDHTKRTLKLLGQIMLNSADGYRLRMNGARVDFNANTMASDSPISVGYADDEITGDKLSVSDGGNVIVIEGHVRTKLMPPKRPAAAAAAPGPAAQPATTPAVAAPSE